ncbi:oxidoreductase [Coprinopsis cinerea okayama7|uniref:Oxidoreductase n=1 Tax=Coprinopsis cinerea (strain Okayama-7 / 130 / ATCC MYA-4618 / FGSC 9003) TaxID=240176 RepID=A8NKJ4_COPC7|nr:oxidoreductase [Coprinopsis cinerea okayama7\|eukprot:XP_001834467.1 oxidoreductase [Coprinopsis cinerea okayama7\
MVFGLFSKKWNPDGKHVYIPGGSQGLGLALATLLVQRGAHVSIVARNQDRLNIALAEMEKCRQTPSQILQARSHSLSTAQGAKAALEAICAAHNGEAPDAVLTCAGSSKPMFFLEMTEGDLANGMTNGYWVQAWTAWAAAKKMAQQKKRGAKIVLVSSMLGYMSFVGWASYAPAKHALRALGDTLQSELMLYGIDVQVFFPPTMYSPGYDEENKTKPQLVKDIEGTDEGLTCEQAALAMFKGMERGDAHISGDILTSLFAASTRGATYRTNFLLEGLFDFVAYIATPVWRSSVDKQVLAHREEHERYLQQKGFFAQGAE